MATTPPALDLHELLLRIDVDYFSRHVLGAPYAAVKSVLYPQPRYRAFVITKRNGSPRVILEPRQRLKTLQASVLAFISARASAPKPCVHGFVKDRSIVSNAERHVTVRPFHLLNLDLEDFFPSISFYRVRGVLRQKPFDCSHEVATLVAHICTYSGALPQGAPTSPLLSNLVCRSLDRDLMALARRHRSTYTRYADDMTFSFSVRDAKNLPSNICTFDSGTVTLGQELLSIIQDQHHFRVNVAKTRMSTRHHRMEVTGITINEFSNVKRAFIDRVRGGLNAWERYGYPSAQTRWEQLVALGRAKPYDERQWRRQTRGGVTPQLKNVVWGKLLYVRMVRGKEDSIYTRLAEKYNALCVRERASDPSFRSSSLPVAQIVRDASDAEHATFVLEWSGDYLPAGATISEMVGGQGTAFAYKRSDQLITCDHVLNWTGVYQGVPTTVSCQSPDVTGVVLRAINPTTGASWPVTVSRRDANRDLAVLAITAGPFAHRHFGGLEAPISRHEQGILIGYPNWSPGRIANQVSAAVQSRYMRSGLGRLEISTSIRQGNSGGPFVNTQFRLAGVAQQGATQQSGNDECLCVAEVDTWLGSAPATLNAGALAARTAAPSVP